MNHIDTANGYINKLILPSSPECPLWNRESQIFSKPMKWNYIDGCMIKAVTMLYEVTGDERLLSYADSFMKAFVDENGNIRNYSPADYNLDNINGGKVLIYLYKKTGDERYRQAYRMLYEKQLAVQPRLDCGNFWHKSIYPYQIWLDGTYMALPFMAEYSLAEDNPEIMDDVMAQLRNVSDIMRDPKTGLYYHGYDETRTMKWADRETGLSREFWMRAMGWLCAALADIYELSPDTETGQQLSQLLDAISGWQYDSGMFLQLPARKNMNGNYCETSGTLLYAYSALKASRLGVTGSDIRRSGEKAFAAVNEGYISMNGSGTPVLRNVCLMAGLGGAAGRDGSAEYYLSEPKVENDAKGIAPYLMAYAEMIKS